MKKNPYNAWKQAGSPGSYTEWKAKNLDLVRVQPPKKKRSQYSTTFKMRVVAEAERTNGEAAARKFHVSPTSITYWRRGKALGRSGPRRNADAAPAIAAILEGVKRAGFVLARCDDYERLKATADDLGGPRVKELESQVKELKFQNKSLLRSTVYLQKRMKRIAKVLS